jgi:hypothetical protein
MATQPAGTLAAGRDIEAHSLKGGIMAWRQAGFPLNPPK